MADASTWKKRVAAWRASGQTAATYCERHGLGLSSLRYWAQQVRREQAAPVAPLRLARVKRVATAEPATVPSVAPVVVIEVGSARVHVERGTDLATLATVLSVLGAGARR